jgi:hypothetical protein
MLVPFLLLFNNAILTSFKGQNEGVRVDSWKGLEQAFREVLNKFFLVVGWRERRKFT